MTGTAPRIYAVSLAKSAAKLLGKLDRPVQARLIAAIATLATQPRPAGVKALTGHPGLMRIRVGDYRVIYTINDQTVVVLVVHLGHRNDVYDTI